MFQLAGNNQEPNPVKWQGDCHRSRADRFRLSGNPLETVLPPRPAKGAQACDIVLAFARIPSAAKEAPRNKTWEKNRWGKLSILSIDRLENSRQF